MRQRQLVSYVVKKHTLSHVTRPSNDGLNVKTATKEPAHTTLDIQHFHAGTSYPTTAAVLVNCPCYGVALTYVSCSYACSYVIFLVENVPVKHLNKHLSTK